MGTLIFLLLEHRESLSLCEEKQIASVSDFSLSQWIVPSSWLRANMAPFYFAVGRINWRCVDS